MRGGMVTEKGWVLIVRTANELLVKKERINKIWFFDAECDDITGGKYGKREKQRNPLYGYR